jgi:hypothetical protein
MMRRILLACCLPSLSCIAMIVDAAKHHTINMEHWELKSLQLGLRGDASAGICPGSSVQVAIVGDAQHKKRKKEKRLETWSGDAAGANRSGKMSFAEFEISVAGGRIDENGWFTTSPDMIATAISGFDVKAVYKRDRKLADAKHFPPSYACITWAGVVGAGGVAGYMGQEGNYGSEGGEGGVGADGGGGGPGSDGGPGGPGGNVVAYATIVRTPHHRHVGLLRVTGDIDQLLFFDPARGITVYASGGAGGPGGQGGAGGAGGMGGPGNPGGPGGTGGPGGNGARGGDGGPGGNAVLVYDAKYPHLAEAVRLDASGGNGGDAGWGGPGGNGGAGGAASGDGASAGADGAMGPEGLQGSPGNGGPGGSARAEAGDVATAFADLPPEITRI